MKIGLFFGSFNPITLGHLHVARTSAEFVDQVWFVIAGQNPDKDPAMMASQEDRLNMVKLAIVDDSAFRACDIEFEMEKPSYTYRTLDAIKEKFYTMSQAGDDYYIICGTDVINTIDSWQYGDRILKENNFICYIRDNINLKKSLIGMRNIQLIKSQNIASSTVVRNLVKDNKSVEALVTRPVFDYIRNNNLYE